jgi:DNA-binding MarR family transcriptional regulator
VRRLVEAALAEAPLRADEYAVYSLIFEAGPLTASEISRMTGIPLTTVLDHFRAMEARGHLAREPHPTDGRALHASLTTAGLDDFGRTNAAWEPMRRQLEESLSVPEPVIRSALQSLDDAARSGLREAPLPGRSPRARGWQPTSAQSLGAGRRPEA